MAWRRRRRSGAEVYHSARPLPRSLIYDPYGALFQPRASTSVRGYGGGYLPHAKRRAATSVRGRGATSLPSGPYVSSYQRPAGARYGAMPHPSPLKSAQSIMLRSRWAYLMPTMLGDRKSMPVRRPKRVSECGLRESRREVLFAQGVAGRSGGSPGRRGTYKRTVMSNFSCRG